MKEKRLYMLEEWNRLTSLAPDKGKFNPLVIEAFKNYFYIGAYTLYERMMNLMDAEKGVTENNMKFMENIHDELTEHILKLKGQGIVKPR